MGERRGVVLVGTIQGTGAQEILGKDGMIILKLNVNKEDRRRWLN
jgi:streptomycin 6-kinase